MALLEWQNLIFVLPMAAAMLYILLMALGISLGEHGDLDVGHDVDLDVDHDVHVEVGDHGDGGHGGHGGHGSLLGSALGLLGVGKVPLSILLLSLCFVWGATGLVLNQFLGVEAMPRTLAFAALAAVVGARLVAEGLGALLPREETYHTPKAELVGQVGEVLYEVTKTSGTVRLSDPSGNLLDLDCRAQTDERFKPGAKVQLLEYDPATDTFFVRG